MSVLAVWLGTLITARLQLHGDHAMYQWTQLENHLALEPSLWVRALSYAHTHAHYAGLLLWPSRLCFDHGFASASTLPVHSLFDLRNLGTAAAYGR